MYTQAPLHSSYWIYQLHIENSLNSVIILLSRDTHSSKLSEEKHAYIYPNVYLIFCSFFFPEDTSFSVIVFLQNFLGVSFRVNLVMDFVFPVSDDVFISPSLANNIFCWAQNSVSTVLFFECFENIVSLPSGLHGFWWEIQNVLDLCSLVYGMLFLCLQYFLFSFK